MGKLLDSISVLLLGAGGVGFAISLWCLAELHGTLALFSLLAAALSVRAAVDLSGYPPAPR
jgi:hypothetical protein